MKKKSFLAVLALGFLLSGCTLTLGQNPPTNADINSLNVTLSGVLSVGTGPGLYTLKTDVGVTPLHDGALELKNFVGSKVTVTGQYSGTTLYVDKAETIY